jgi:hypothetical protein
MERTSFSAELESFSGLWRGGFYEGDPLDPLGKSGYGPLNYMGVLYVTYLRCIKPYVNPQTIALEIGPGRGAWTKALLPAKEVWCLDALTAEHNRIFEFLQHPRNVRYFQVHDFSCDMLPEDYFDYMFSFACLCHVSFAGITEYARNIFPKLKHGSNCFWMIADYSKYNNAVSNLATYSIYERIVPQRVAFRFLFRLFEIVFGRIRKPLAADTTDAPTPGRWYDAGVERTCSLLERVGYKIIDPDVGVNHRDPVIHFFKP